MDLGEFYGAVLPPTGHYALFDKATRSHIWAATIAELVEKTNKYGDKPDVYFATGAFQKGTRTQDACTGKKCFYLDIDAGAEKFAKTPNGAYPTVQDALGAVQRFCEQSFVRPTYYVFSGGGLHVYWVLDEVLPAVIWTRIAERFKAGTKAAGLKADPTSTADAARILRPVGTRHNNGRTVMVLGTPGPTYRSLDFAAALKRLPTPEPELSFLDQAAAKYGALANAINDDTKTSFEPTPTNADKIVQHCAALAECKNTVGNVVEPQWRAMLGILKHCIDGQELAHEWSKGHPEYSKRDTQTKFDRYEAGPPTCETFGSYSDKCLGCEHKGKIKSPIVLGRVTVQDKQADPQLAAKVEAIQPPPAPAPPAAAATIPTEAVGDPFFYRIETRNQRLTLCGSKMIKVESPTGGEVETRIWIPLTTDIFWLSGWTEAGDKNADMSMLTLNLHRDGKHLRFELPNEATADRKTLGKWLASKAINPINHEQATVVLTQQYIADQIQRIKLEAARPVIRDHLGIHMHEDGSMSAAYGNVVIHANGRVIRANVGSNLSHVRDAIMLESLPPNKAGMWGPEVWNDVRMAAQRQVDFYREWFGKPGLEVAQLAIMLQLASPMLMFAAEEEMVPGGQLPSIGVTVSLYSQNSGKGKTSIQLASAYAFGNAAALVRQGDRQAMTFNAQIATAAALGTMPFPLDEVTQNDKQQVAEFINRMSSGIEKGRSQKDGSVAHAPLRWALVSTVSTNIPQRELLSEFQSGSDALQMRLIELNCDALPNRELSAVHEYDAAIRGAMNGTKGSLGALIHLAIVRKGYARMRTLVDEKKRYLTAKTPGEIKERFVLRGFAAMLAVQDLLLEMGLGLFSTEILEGQMMNTFGDVRARSISAVTAEETGTNFMNMLREFSPNMFITKEDIFDATDMVFLENATSFRGPAKGRVCRSSQQVYIVVQEMRKWALDKGISPTVMLAEAAKSGILINQEPRLVTLSRGIKEHWVPRVKVISATMTSMRGIDAGLGENVATIRTVGDSDDRNRVGRKASGS